MYGTMDDFKELVSKAKQKGNNVLKENPVFIFDKTSMVCIYFIHLTPPVIQWYDNFE